MDLRSAQNQAKDICRELDLSAKNLQDIQSDIDSAQERIGEAKSERDSYREEYSSLKGVADSRSRKDQIREDLDEIRDRLESLRTDLRLSKDQIKKERRRYKQCEADANRLASYLGKSLRELSRGTGHAARLDSLLAAIGGFASDIDRKIEEAISATEEIISSLREDVDDASAKQSAGDQIPTFLKGPAIRPTQGAKPNPFQVISKALPSVKPNAIRKAYQLPHAINDVGKIEAMKAAMDDADCFCFDPVVVCRDYLIDGVHRLAAAQEANYQPELVQLEVIFKEDGKEWDETCEEDYNQGDLVALIDRLSSQARQRYGIELHWG